MFFMIVFFSQCVHMNCGDVTKSISMCLCRHWAGTLKEKILISTFKVLLQYVLICTFKEVQKCTF